MTDIEKHEIRNKWCDQLCIYFNIYHKTGRKPQIRTPFYTAQVLSKFGILDFDKIDFSEKINIGENSPRTNNENLIYQSFDDLIEKRIFIGDLMNEFRNEFNNDVMPF